MTALAVATQSGFPLGKPVDRDRYGMTPEQAILYRWLVKNRPHDRPFNVMFKVIAPLFKTKASNIHRMVANLVDRGWLARDDAGYRFVHPIMIYGDRR